MDGAKLPVETKAPVFILSPLLSAEKNVLTVNEAKPLSQFSNLLISINAAE
jgi:hypothetical protein